VVPFLVEDELTKLVGIFSKTRDWAVRVVNDGLLTCLSSKLDPSIWIAEDRLGSRIVFSLAAAVALSQDRCSNDSTPAA